MKTKRFLYWLFPITWMGVIYFASAQPYQDQDIKPFLSELVDLNGLIPLVDWIKFTYHSSEVSVSALGIYSFVEFFLRKGAHFTVFFILILFFYLALSKTINQGIKRRLIIALILTVSYAALDEIHQGFTPNRTPYIGDVVIDTVGATFGLLMIYSIKRMRHRKH